MKFGISVVIVTPEMAAEWLSKSRESGRKNYRKIDAVHVRKMAQDMNEDRWADNGDPIRVASDGLVVDGQHRLTAIMLSGKAQSMVVFSGYDDELIDVRLIDTGKNRKIATHIAAAGIPHASLVASVARLAITYQRGGWSKTENMNRHMLRESEIHDYVETWSDALVDSARLANRCRFVATISLVGVLLFIGGRGRKPSEMEQTSEFVEKLSSGVGLSVDDPVFCLRRKTIESRTSSYKRLTPYADRTLMTHCWNKHVLGKPLKVVKFLDSCPAEIEAARF
jgi:hypothetical protein